MDRVIPPAVIFSRLTPSAMRWGVAGGSVSGLLSAQSEASALCAGMPNHCFLAGMVMWTADLKAAQALQPVLLYQVRSLAGKERWKIRGMERLEAMTTMAIAELFVPNEGNGRVKRLSCAEVAQQLGISTTSYHRCWKQRYSRVAAIPAQWAHAAGTYLLDRQHGRLQ